MKCFVLIQNFEDDRLLQINSIATVSAAAELSKMWSGIVAQRLFYFILFSVL